MAADGRNKFPGCILVLFIAGGLGAFFLVRDCVRQGGYQPPPPTAAERAFSERMTRKAVQLAREDEGSWPEVAENEDIRGADNDADDRPETVFVRGYYRKDGTYVPSHYRDAPSR